MNIFMDTRKMSRLFTCCNTRVEHPCSSSEHCTSQTYSRHTVTGAYFTTTVLFTDMYLQGLTSLRLYVLQTCISRGLLHYYCTFYRHVAPGGLLHYYCTFYRHVSPVGLLHYYCMFYRHIATGAYFTTTVRFTDT